MEIKTYSAPRCEVCKTRMRMNILAGSDNAINGTSHADVPNPPTMPWDSGAKMRTEFE